MLKKIRWFHVERGLLLGMCVPVLIEAFGHYTNGYFAGYSLILLLAACIWCVVGLVGGDLPRLSCAIALAASLLGGLLVIPAANPRACSLVETDEECVLRQEKRRQDNEALEKGSFFLSHRDEDVTVIPDKPAQASDGIVLGSGVITGEDGDSDRLYFHIPAACPTGKLQEPTVTVRVKKYSFSDRKTAVLLCE